MHGGLMSLVAYHCKDAITCKNKTRIRLEKECEILY